MMNHVRSGLAFLGFLTVGTGIGMFFDNTEAGGAVGFGLGMLSILVLRRDK
jgi:hypothetical protein